MLIYISNYIVLPVNRHVVKWLGGWLVFLTHQSSNPRFEIDARIFSNTPAAATASSRRPGDHRDWNEGRRIAFCDCRRRISVDFSGALVSSDITCRTLRQWRPPVWPFSVLIRIHLFYLCTPSSQSPIYKSRTSTLVERLQRRVTSGRVASRTGLWNHEAKANSHDTKPAMALL